MDSLNKAISLLQQLISTPSFSNEEDEGAGIWERWLNEKGVENVGRFHNNIYALSSRFDADKPILMLNSHIDTVKPVASYTRDPFTPAIEDGRLYGLGSNDAGGAGVALAMTFLKYKDDAGLPFNLLLALTASEERMGELGMRAFLPHLKEKGLYPSMAIVGEPTGCDAAIAERGLVVCDAEVAGVAGHAARDTGENAIYRALDDIGIIRNKRWDKKSDVLGDIRATVTMIDAGTQHNIIPDKCRYVVDIRTTDAYSNEETVSMLQQSLKWSRLTPRSTRIRASVLSRNHPLASAAQKAGLNLFISPTTSDMALMHDFPSIKIGPGKSERSHTADEYIEINELKRGLETYQNLIKILSDCL